MAVPWIINGATAALGTPRANAFRVAIMARFPGQLVSWGTYSCRRQTLGSNWSAHAWGNADDIHPLTPAIGDKAVAWTLANARTFGVDTSQVLWRGVEGHYPGHFHVAFLPNLESSGAVPPCQGGPSVTLSGGAVAVGGNKTTVPGPNRVAPVNGQCPPGYHPRAGSCYKDVTIGVVPPGISNVVDAGKAIAGAVTSIPEFLGKVPVYLKITAGGVLVLAGLAAVLVAATGAPIPGPASFVKAKGAGGGGGSAVPARAPEELADAAQRAQKARVAKIRQEARARARGREEGILRAREGAARKDAKRYRDTEAPEPTAAERRRGNIRSVTRVRSA